MRDKSDISLTIVRQYVVTMCMIEVWIFDVLILITTTTQFKLLNDSWPQVHNKTAVVFSYQVIGWYHQSTFYLTSI